MTPPGKRIPKPTKVSQSTQQWLGQGTKLQQQFQPTTSHSPSTCTTQGSVPPSLHHSPLGCPTSLPGLQHIGRPGSLREICGSRNSNYNGVSRHPLGLTPKGNLSQTILPPGIQPSPRKPKENCTPKST
jgi:hypothetical protein